MGRPQPETIDIRERGGEGKTSDRRLFIQFLAFTGCRDTAPIIDGLARTGLDAAVYLDVNDPLGFGMAVASEDPSAFVDVVRPLVQGGSFTGVTPRPEFTTFGRTYSLGYEPDLDEVLINRPRRHLLEQGWPWAIWYPLRRKGSFQQLDAGDQRDILMEHGKIGYAFGAADLAHDIRLACHGLDTNDNDFVIALMGKDLAPLSKIVETMRKTKQTSMYLEKLGPFFVGKKVWQGMSNVETRMSKE